MKVAIINASPKAKDSASGVFAGDVADLLGEKAECVPFHWSRPGIAGEELEAFAACDAAVLVFPLYVDSLPSHLLRVLQQLEAHFQADGERRGPTVYAVVNCGFFEGDQNRLSLEVLRHWCARAGLDWGMGIGVGGGPMLCGIPPGAGLRKSLREALHTLAGAILTGASPREDRFVSPNFPRRLYIAIAHTGWRLEARRNGLKGKQLYGKRSV